MIGYPSNFFKEYVKEDDHLMLVALDNEHLEFTGVYKQSEILGSDNGGAYGWQKADVPTYAVSSVMITCNYETSSSACQEVGRFESMVKKNLSYLQTRWGHPKWNQVDLLFSEKIWSQSECVKNAPDVQSKECFSF